uniref:hypothetical protein n=1 Tax=Thermococcus sp. TaxID=35749 RepID=UPI0025CC0C5F
MKVLTYRPSPAGFLTFLLLAIVFAILSVPIIVMESGKFRFVLLAFLSLFFVFSLIPLLRHRRMEKAAATFLHDVSISETVSLPVQVSYEVGRYT